MQVLINLNRQQQEILNIVACLWARPPGHTTLLRRWINVIDVDSQSQQRRVFSGVTELTDSDWLTLPESMAEMTRVCVRQCWGRWPPHWTRTLCLYIHSPGATTSQGRFDTFHAAEKWKNNMTRNMNNLISNTMSLRVNEFPSRTDAVGFHYETYGEINHLALTLPFQVYIRTGKYILHQLGSARWAPSSGGSPGPI